MKSLKAIGWTSCLYHLKWITLIYIFSLAVELGSKQLKASYWWDGALLFSMPRGKCLTKLLPNPVRSKTKTSFPPRKSLSAAVCSSFYCRNTICFSLKTASATAATLASLAAARLAVASSSFSSFVVLGGGLPQLKLGQETSVMLLSLTLSTGPWTRVIQDVWTLAAVQN